MAEVRSIDQPELPTAFIVKIAGRCDLNCSYCYMYSKGDRSYLALPRIMTREIAAAGIARVVQYARRRSLDEVELALHGGEPLLAGVEWVEWFLGEARLAGSREGVEVKFAVQTNGTRINRRWLELLNGYDVRLGLSCDGPKEVHDRARLYYSGRGSYERVKTSIELLARDYTAPWGILTVANPDYSSVATLRHFLDLGVNRVDFLWPDFHHDDPPPWPPGHLAKYYCSLFDYWYHDLAAVPRIRWLESAISLLMHGPSHIDALGAHAVTDVMIETDGAWQALDSLRICADGLTQTGLNVLEDDVESLWKVPLYQIGLQSQELLAEACLKCSFESVCGGGYLPHRYSKRSGFNNPSVHCGDLWTVLAHIRGTLVHDLEAVLGPNQVRHQGPLGAMP